MTAITMDKVKLTGIMNIDRVLQFTAHAIANEHAHMYFEGIVAAADGREYMSMPMAGQEMQLKCDVEGTDKPYFAGQVLRAVIAEEGGLFTVKCECISGSYRFDLSKKSRSFQYTPTTYAEMFKWIQDKDKIGNILVIKGADTQIGYPIIQYEETDWEFAKRMAGHFGTVVLPEITDGFPQMSVGVIKGNTYEIGENSRYEEGKRIAAYRKKNPVSPCALTDFRTMRVMDYRNFELGDKVNFKGETWIVMGKEIRMVQSLLEVWYVLGLEQGYGLPKHYNAHISGMSILGEVIYTDHENLKIHLDIDEKQDVEKAYKYTWMPATGNLMYCMPKLGTRVSLYMPDSHEGNAYATECVRTNGGTACGEMADYNVRQFLTEHDKRMTMAPASMQFVGSSKENNNIVRLEDEKGLYFDSQQPIYMQSGGNFIVSAGGKVNVQSNKNIVVHKSRVKSGFELSGSEVNIYAKKFYRNGQTSGAAGPLAAETASGTPFPFGLMIGALLGMLPFICNSFSEGDVQTFYKPIDEENWQNKVPANTGTADKTPNKFVQNKTHWCYAVCAMALARNDYKQSVKKKIDNYINSMPNGRIYYDKADGSMNDLNYPTTTGVQANYAGYDSSVNKYYCDPEQECIILNYACDGKGNLLNLDKYNNNVDGNAYHTLKQLTDKPVKYNSKGWLDANNQLDLNVIRTNLLDPIDNGNTVIVDAFAGTAGHSYLCSSYTVKPDGTILLDLTDPWTGMTENRHANLVNPANEEFSLENCFINGFHTPAFLNSKVAYIQTTIYLD